MKHGAQIVALVGVCALSAFGTGRAGTSERIVADRLTGLAIAGYDPVAFFTDAAVREGSADLELDAGGAIWRFRNEGNRAAFAARPDIYMPQFGGYDPLDVARGVARAGQAQFWLVADQRLYLFGDAESRAAFAASPGDAYRAARETWPAVEKLLAR